MKPKTYRTGLLVLGASLLSTSAWAATITVGPTGDHATLQAAVAAASTGDTITLSAGTHGGPAFVLNKAVTISGPNAGLAGTAVRGPEARISDTSIVITAAGAVLDGVEIYQNVNTNDAVQIQAAATVQNTVFRREGAVGSNNGRGIVTTGGVSGAVITNNFFTGDNSANVFSNHKTWQSGIYVNGGSLTISNNTFEKVRAALNLDDFNSGVSISGNTFRDTSGTYIALGGVTPTAGSHTISGNDFGINLSSPGPLPSAIVNNSNVASGFRIDVTGNTFGGTASGSLTSADKFAIEPRMYHRGRGNKIGVIDYVADQQIQVAGTSLQSAVDAASAGDTILVGGANTLSGQTTINKQLVIDGIDKTTAKLSGSASIGGYFLLFNSGAAGSTVRNLTIEKTDKNNQNMIGLQAANLTFANLTITGQYVLGDGEVSRAFEIGGGANGFTIAGSTISGLRQPAYINAVSSGTVQDNHVAGTRGWVVDGGLVSFTGNTWGQGAAANAVDIALLASTPYSPLYDPLSALIAANNGATISNQRTAVQVHNRTANSSHASIQAAINAASPGDDLEIYPGSFSEAVTINKPVDLIGSGTAATTISSSGQVISITSAGSGSSVKGLTVTGGTRGFNLSNATGILLENVASTGNSSFGINFNGANADVTLRDSSFSSNGSSGIKVESSGRVSNFLVEGSTLDGNTYGLYSADGNAATYQANAQLQGITVRNSSFSNNSGKGLFIESMNDGLFEGLTIANSGTGTTGGAGSGFDINLKFADYTNLTIRDSVITGCGVNYSFGGGLLIKARNDGSTYSANPATLGGTVLVEGVRVEGNGKAGNGAGIRIGDAITNVSPSNVVIRNSTLSGNNNYAVLNLVAGSTVEAKDNHWGAASGPVGATTNMASANVNYMPWYAVSTSATPPVLSQPRTGVVENTEIDDEQPPVEDLYVAPGKTITVTPTGSLSVEKIELAEGAEIVVEGGDLNIGEGSKISGSFTIFNSFGSWNVNGDTTFEISQALALVTDIHVAAGKTITVNGGGELILDGCVIDSQTPGSSYNIVAEDDGLLTVARSVVSDAVIDINTETASVDANLKSKVYDNSFTNSDIEATADAGVYHNLFDAATDTAVNSDGTTAFDAIDGWDNVTDVANLQNKFTLDFATPADPVNTLDTNGNLFVRPNDAVVVNLNVASLASNTIVNAEALLGFNSGFIELDTPAAAVVPATGWDVVVEGSANAGSLGLVDSTLGLEFSGNPDGINADSTIGTIDFTAVAPGATVGFFRVQTDRVFEPGGRLLKDTRLTKSLAGIPSDLTAFTSNTGELVIDDQPPVIDENTADARQVQPSVFAPVDVFDSANRVFRNGESVELTFDATDNGHGLSGLDAADAANDLVIIRNGVPLTSGYTVGTTEAGGVVTYTVTLAIPATTPAGSYEISATVRDRSGNPSAETDLGTYVIANEALVTVELQGFGGTTRDVTFVATGGATTGTWTKTVSFTGSVGSVILEDVPANTTSISAKTAWTLRSKVTASFTAEGVGSATLTGTDKLLGGDINGDNVINTFDYSILRYNFGTFNTVGDINGDGGVSTGDYNLQRANFYQIGKGQ